MKVEIKYLSDVYNDDKVGGVIRGDWHDLRASDDVICPANGTALVSLGVAMSLPEGFESMLAPRSSNLVKRGLLSPIGVIDNKYCGDDDEWKLPVYNIKDEEEVIKAGERIAQFRIFESQPAHEFCEVEHLGESRGGFGSTGIK